MIAQVLNDQFLLNTAGSLRSDLLQAIEDKGRRSGDQGPLEDVPVEDMQAVADELLRILRQTRPENGSAKDGVAYMPREPLLAILQTVLEEVAEDQRPQAIEPNYEEADRRSGPGHLMADRRFVTDDRRAFGAFEVTRPVIFSDPRWVLSGVVILWHRRWKKDKVRFGGLPTGHITVADDARILLVGDWGSGTVRARAVSEQMKLELDAGRAVGREQHVVHLGDVDHTGSRRQYEQNFLANWPVDAGQGISSYNMVGNHDMYEGGFAYYELCLADPRFAAQEGRSAFALRSNAWQFLALDSAYEDEALHGGQTQWVLDELAANPGHRTALLSHHQLFSAYEECPGRLSADIQPVLDTGRVDAWFWAHEHRCLTYEPYLGVGFSSCVGHGGIPEYLVSMDRDELLAPLRYDYRQKWGTGIEPWNTFGFVVLELDGKTLRMHYIDEYGTQHHEERLEA